jgi:DNA polymerase III alpha subunit
VQLAARLKLPVVATHPVQFTLEDDYEAHEARVCISEGEILGNQRRVRRFTREQYFKSPPRCRRCLPMCPRRWPTRWRSRAAAA